MLSKYNKTVIFRASMKSESQNSENCLEHSTKADQGQNLETVISMHVQ